MTGNVIKIALRALARNKVRSALTMLGIIIGVASVIAMVSLGQGAQQQVQDQISSMGTNMLVVSAGSQRTGGVRGGSGSASTITLEDVEAIAAIVEQVAREFDRAIEVGRAALVDRGGNRGDHTGKGLGQRRLRLSIRLLASHSRYKRQAPPY